MTKVGIHAPDPEGGAATWRGTYDFSRVPTQGELIEIFTSGEAVLVQVESVVHTVDRATHDAEAYCRYVASGESEGRDASALVKQALSLR